MGRCCIEEITMADVITIDSPWCAFAPGKQEWKADGNFFTPEELARMEQQDDIAIFSPSETILSAD